MGRCKPIKRPSFAWSAPGRGRMGDVDHGRTQEKPSAKARAGTFCIRRICKMLCVLVTSCLLLFPLQWLRRRRQVRSRKQYLDPNRRATRRKLMADSNLLQFGDVGPPRTRR